MDRQFRFLMVAALAAWFGPATCQAVIVRNTQENTTAPSDDPGWDNVTQDGASMVYLGDSWLLTVRHIGIPTRVHLSVGSFDTIPGTSVTVKNPTGLGLTRDTDLQLIRVNANPDLPSLKISASPPPFNSQVTMIGRGNNRRDQITSWQVNTSTSTWTWTEAPAGNYSGFKIDPDAGRTKRWGTNRIASDNAVTGENDPDNTTIVRPGGRDVVSLVTSFDSLGTQFEAQAHGGDSGGGVFYKRAGQWELAGIMNSIFTHPNQSINWVVYTNATAFADLSIYRDDILDIMGNPNYSVMGDINLDGIVSGDGTGPAASDDLSAFAEGWRHRQAVANIDSWKKGDLNQDAVTDFQDFILVRNAVGRSISLQGLLGEGVPEPAAGVLLLLAAATAAATRRRRRK